MRGSRGASGDSGSAAEAGFFSVSVISAYGLPRKRSGIRVGRPGNLLPRHWMTAQKERSIGKTLGCRLRDAEFGTARVCDERVSRSESRDVRKQVERRANRKRNVNQVGSAQRRRQVAVVRVVNNLA